MAGRSGETTNRAYDTIRTRILSAAYAPGELLREVAVAEDLGVSRTPVREALIRLAENGLLQRTARGLRVRRRTADELDEVYEACLVVEPAVTALAALRRRSSHLTALEDALARTERAVEAGEEDLHLLMDEWHLAVWRAAGNDPLHDVLEMLSAQLFSIPAPAAGITEWSRSLEAHREMTDAIRAHDAALASELMRRHLEAGRQAAVRAAADSP